MNRSVIETFPRFCMRIRPIYLALSFAGLLLALAMGCSPKGGFGSFFELPSALTKASVEANYRPQLERLREIASHPERYTEERDQRSLERQRLAHEQGGNAAQQVILMSRETPIDTDSRLFADPSIIEARAAIFSRESSQDVGGPYAYQSEPHAPEVVSMVQFSRSPLTVSDSLLLPAWVKFSDGSRRQAAVYDGKVVDDGGEERRFQLVLDLKMVISKTGQP